MVVLKKAGGHFFSSNMTHKNHRIIMNRQQNSKNAQGTKQRRKVLLLHGNRQTGEVLLGRIDKIRKAFSRELDLDVVAPDAPHFFSDGDLDCNDANNSSIDDSNNDLAWQRTWWHRNENAYNGFEESMSMLEHIWNCDDEEFVAIIGFSQGSRLAHIISLLHTITNGAAFPGLECVLHFSGYGDVSMTDNFYTYLKENWSGRMSQSVKLNDCSRSYQFEDVQINLHSLHVMGERDKLVPLKSSEALLKSYIQPAVYVHPGSHFVPVKKLDVERYVEFFGQMIDGDIAVGKTNTQSNSNSPSDPPEEEHAQSQIDEVTAISQIFPSEFSLLSNSTPIDPDNYDPDDYTEENRTYEHPIKYSIRLEQTEDELWPPKDISLSIQYPAKYPDASPLVLLVHEMNYLEFSLQATETLMQVVRKAMEEEAGMPCVMGVVYAARDFFESGGLASCTNATITAVSSSTEIGNASKDEKEQSSVSTLTSLRPSSAARIKECNAQGLQIARTLLGRAQSNNATGDVDVTIGGKGGIWKYTIGLVGKPSAGKSTFFNAATAFARQRGEGGGEARCEDDAEETQTILGGASMAPHPFTTIDPNIGYCLVPAPAGACPEDEDDNSDLAIGSTHGRDSKGRRFIPVCLKDVAGLVPGAYQGRGRGNKFLDDLTDADVLVHVVNASGSSDAEGNELHSDLSHPINDLEWVRNELVEWVYFNLSCKWDSVVRRGKDKLVGMFSGYKQSQAFTYDVLAAVERFVKENEGRDLFDDLGEWDEGELHRLVSAFLGARFPMALALNKNDLPSATQYISDIQAELPIHGAHAGVGLSAHEEMKFIRNQLTRAIIKSPNESLSSQSEVSDGRMAGKVWDCLQSAVSLREPTLVFPVNDFKTYEPLPGMESYASRDSSLPNYGFISCIEAAGGKAPSQWDSLRKIYAPGNKGDAKHALRDVILMKPNSTVEDVFSGLKGMGALAGEFVRAEGASRIGEKPKLVSKSEPIGRHNRILRIMTTKKPNVVKT